MSELVTNKFVAALRTLEETKDTASLVALYSEDAAVGNLIASDQFHGLSGAQQFWAEYRAV